MAASSDTGPPHLSLRYKELLLTFDGNDSRFYFRLNDRIATTGRIRLVQYVVTGGTSEVMTFFFGPEANMELVKTSSNTIQPGGFSILCSGATENVVYSPGLLIAQTPNRELQEFSMSIRDDANAEHNPTSNKLFDKCILRLHVEEIQGPRNPGWLQQIPAIQQVMDTV